MEMVPFAPLTIQDPCTFLTISPCRRGIHFNNVEERPQLNSLQVMTIEIFVHVANHPGEAAINEVQGAAARFLSQMMWM